MSESAGNAIAESAEFTARGTLRQKYAYQDGYQAFSRLTAEIVKALEEAWPSTFVSKR